MTTSEQINELAAALAKAQAEMGGATKGSANPFFKSKYADLSSVWDACREPLTKHGLAVVQMPSFSSTADGPTVVTVETRLIHASGQFMSGAISAAPKDDSPQAIGSVVTYLRRYALQSVVGVAPEDDDAEAAQGRGRVAQAPAEPMGFQNWLSDLEATADEGTTALEATWKSSKAEFRAYLTAQAPQKWDAIKKRASKAKDLVRS